MGRVEEILEGARPEVWFRLTEAWRRSERVYDGLADAFESLLLRAFLGRFPDCESLLFGGLADPSPHVRAYCLLGLVERRSPRLRELPESILTGRETIRFAVGPIEGECALGEYAFEMLYPVDVEDYAAQVRSAEAEWSGRERACPRCGTHFFSLKNWGRCPGCAYAFFASHPERTVSTPYPRRRLVSDES